MKTKKVVPQAAEVAQLEAIGTELIPVEASREEKEGIVEQARAAALKQVQPELAPLDKKERSLKKKAVEMLRAGRKIKGFFPKGAKTVHTRSIVGGFKKGPAHVRIAKGTNEADLIKYFEENGHPEVVQVKKRLHRTTLRQMIRIGAIDKKDLKKLGITVVQREHAWVKTKTAKRKPVKASARKAGKRKTVKPR
jgi:hypothetical protein